METIPSSSIANTRDSNFLSSTFGFFALALAVTAAGSFAGFSLASTNPALFSNPMIFYGTVIVELILVFTAQAWSRSLPFGYGMFALFAFLSGFTLVPILAMVGAVGGAPMIVKAFMSSVSVFAAAAIYGWITHRNIMGMGGFLVMTLIGVIILSIVGIFIPWNNTVELIISGGTVVLFAGFTMYNVQAIQRGLHTNPLLAAISLYLDFINIFTSILRFMIAMRRD